MGSKQYLIDLALILVTTKLFGILTRKADLPQVVGALAAGLVLGPTVLGIVHESDFVNQMAEIGVIVLMFHAGLETDINELKKTGRSSLLIALCGVVAAGGGGFLLAWAFHVSAPDKALIQNIFVGVILMSTSVSITVETLKEMGKLSTKSGNTILAAALIDDVLGIVALTVITSMAGSGANLWLVGLKILLFFLLSLGAGVVVHNRVERWMVKSGGDRRRFVVTSLAFCLVFSYIGERFFGIADITGAFIAGLIIANTMRVLYVASRFEILSYMFLSPVFFANIGCKVSLPQMSGSLVVFTLLMILLAVASKVGGCGLGAALCKFGPADSGRIGIGMIARGEVTLIVAAKGAAAGLMNPALLGPVAVTVVATAIVTPVLLKLAYKGKKKDYSELEYSTLLDRYQDMQNVDLATQALIEMNYEMQEAPEEKEPPEE